MDKEIFFQYITKTVSFVTVAIYLILFTRVFVVEAGQVSGRSMEKTYLTHDLFLVDKVTLLTRAPRRDDIVQLVNKTNGTVLIKRIIGLPGETITVKTNNVFITPPGGQEFELIEPYLQPYTVTASMTGRPTTYGPLGPNEYFVMGDNRTMSGDSREFGPIGRDAIFGLASPALKL